MKKFRVFVKNRFLRLISWYYKNKVIPVELLMWALVDDAIFEAWDDFPKLGHYEYSDLFKIGDTWFVNKTWKPHVWPEIDFAELVSVQPLTAPTNIKFELRYRYDDEGWAHIESNMSQPFY